MNDHDASGDAVDDTVTTALITVDAIRTGAFEDVRFDCTPGAFVRPADLACVVSDASDFDGNPLAMTCTVADLESVL